MVWRVIIIYYLTKNMRKSFANELVKAAETDKNIWVVTADLGMGLWDEFKSKFPDRFINTGASEQAASDIVVGLALSGKKPFFYSITPFLIYRCFETLRTYINHEKIPVRLVGSGRNGDYFHDGFSHNASDVWDIMSRLREIHCYYPEKKEMIPAILKAMIKEDQPSFISLKK